MKPVKRKVPMGRPGSLTRSVAKAAETPKKKPPGKPTKATGDYNFAKGGTPPGSGRSTNKKKKADSAWTRLKKLRAGGYTKP